MHIRGIDVSEFNGKIDWPAVKASGIQFAMIRAGYGKSTENRDTRFDENMAGARAAGLDVGAYWFGYAYRTDLAVNEAHAFLEIMEPYKGEVAYPLCYDWEADSYRYAQTQGVTPSRTLITDMAIAFLNELQDNNWYAMNYTNQDFYYNKFQMERLSAYDVWLAKYGGSTDIVCGIRQTSNQGQINGIGSTYVDLDSAYKDYPAIMKQAGLNGYKKENNTDKDEEANDMLYNTVAEVPQWARPTIQKLVDKKYIIGEADGNLALNDTMLRLLVINDRAGLYQ